MKKWLVVIRIVAVTMIVPLFFTFFAASWNVGFTEKTHFTEKQIQEICELLHFELASGETMTTTFFPGSLQAVISLSVHIEGIESEEAFLSRFKGKITSDNTMLDSLYTDQANSYNVELFTFEDHALKDYCTQLSFLKKSGGQEAIFHIVGYIPQLRNVYDFLNKPFQPYLTYLPFMMCFIFEFMLVLFLIIRDLTNIYGIKKEPSI